MSEYEIYKNGDIITFERDHGECYGGLRKTNIDTEGKKDNELYAHIEDHAGAAFADAAREQGYC